jgi:hypothetical protein
MDEVMAWVEWGALVLVGAAVAVLAWMLRGLGRDLDGY